MPEGNPYQIQRPATRLNPVGRSPQRATAPAAEPPEATGGSGLGQDTHTAQNPQAYNGRYPGYGYAQPGYGYPSPQQPTYPTYPQPGYGYPSHPQQPTYPTYPQPGYGYPSHPQQPTYPTYPQPGYGYPSHPQQPTYPQPGYGPPGYPGYGYPPGSELGYAIGNLLDSFKQLFGGR